MLKGPAHQITADLPENGMVGHVTQNFYKIYALPLIFKGHLEFLCYVH
jgi:hypothetical protein